MNRFLPLLLMALTVLTASPEVVPDVDCSWELPEASTDRVSGIDGFTGRGAGAGSYTAEELPAVYFYSDQAGEETILESGIATDSGDCSAGCAAGGRIEQLLAPGNHTLTAQALTPRGTVACEASSTVLVNTPPSVESVTFSPTEPQTGDDITYTASTSDPDGDEASVSNTWTGPDGQQLVGETLTSLQTSVGETWELAVLARDPWDTGEAFAAEITIANTPPEAPSVVISPVPAPVNDSF